MDVKEAVKSAVAYVKDLYEDEGAQNFGLEEVVQDKYSGEWTVTVGFSRPWDFPQQTFATAIQGRTPTRQYKVVTLNDVGEVTSVKIREIKD